MVKSYHYHRCLPSPVRWAPYHTEVHLPSTGSFSSTLLSDNLGHIAVITYQLTSGYGLFSKRTCWILTFWDSPATPGQLFLIDPYLITKIFHRICNDRSYMKLHIRITFSFNFWMCFTQLLFITWHVYIPVALIKFLMT